MIAKQIFIVVVSIIYSLILANGNISLASLHTAPTVTAPNNVYTSQTPTNTVPHSAKNHPPHAKNQKTPLITHPLNVDAIIFSYDRPSTVEWLLDSMAEYMTGIGSISIVYRASESCFDDAYQIVAQRYPNVIFYKQGNNPTQDFKPLTLKALFTSPHDHIFFAVDDNLVTDYIDLHECVRALQKTHAYAFFLRLGKNIDFFYTTNQAIVQPPLKEELITAPTTREKFKYLKTLLNPLDLTISADDQASLDIPPTKLNPLILPARHSLLATAGSSPSFSTKMMGISRDQPMIKAGSEQITPIYSWTTQDKCSFCWAYPHTVDMTIYKKHDIIDFFVHGDYTNPNILEARWSREAKKLVQKKFLCYEYSRITNLPLNKVQTIFVNKAMDLYTTHELLDIFNQGLIMDRRPLEKIRRRSCHIEYEPTFCGREG